MAPPPDSPDPGSRAASAASLKVAFIGTHGVGKTTLCYGLAARLKARDYAVEVVHEIARRCPLPINEATSVESESWILHTQIAEEIVAQHRYPVVVCDRSALDNYVYMLLTAPRRPELDALVDGWTATYDLLVHVPIVDQPSPDGIRSADPAFQRAVEELLEREMERRGLQPFRLDRQDRAGWLDAVDAEARRRLRPAQMELL